MSTRKPTALARLSPACLIAGLALLVLAVAPRFVGLGWKPLMHDESLFAYYAFHALENSRIPGFDGPVYTHQPILHGPTLILTTARVFGIFGDSIVVARAWIAFLSLVALGALLALWPRRLRWWLAPLLLTSPVLLFYSRFFRNDMLHNAILMLGMLGVVKGFTRWPRGVFWSVPGMALMLATITVKENALFAYAAGITFGLFYMAVRLVMRWWPVGRRFLWSVRARRTAPAPRRRPAPATPAVQEGWGLHLERDEPPLALRRLTQIGGWFTGVLLGLTLIALVFGRLAGQADVELSITDPTPARVWMLARARDWGWLNLLASWQYWEGQHSEHRIEGPLHYHLPILLTYELPLLLLLYGGVAWDATGRRRRALLHAAGVVLWVVLWAGWRASYSGSVGWLAPLRGQPPAWLGPFNDVAAFLHIAPNLSMLFLGMLIVPLLVWSLLQVAEHRVLAAWAGWWAACSLFQYSSAGEKVPWLAVHITLPLYLAVAWVWGPLVSRGVRGARMTLIAAGLAGAAIGLLADVRLIRDGANPRERIVFNHTTNELDQRIKRSLALWELLSDELPAGQRRVLMIDATALGGPSWPGFWYFRHQKYDFYEVDFMPASLLDTRYDFVMATESTIEPLLDQLEDEGWQVHRLSLRDHWMAPWPAAAEWDRWRRDDIPEEVRPSLTQLLGFSIPAWWRYYWLRETWTEPGGFPIVVLTPAAEGAQPVD